MDILADSDTLMRKSLRRYRGTHIVIHMDGLTQKEVDKHMTDASDWSFKFKLCTSPLYGTKMINPPLPVFTDKCYYTAVYFTH